MKPSAHSIIQEQPIIVTATLACLLGLEAAIVLQKIQFLAGSPTFAREIGGNLWVGNTLEEWKTNYFPFWSKRTIRRILDALEEQEALAVCQPDGLKRMKYYRVSEGALDMF